MTAKEELHQEIEQLSDALAVLWLAALRGDRLAWTLLHAPPDDEPVTKAEQAAGQEAYEDLAAGRVGFWDGLRRDLGL